MKTYDEMTASVFQRRDEYVKDKKTKQKRIAALAVSLSCVALVAALGIGTWLDKHTPAPIEEAKDAIIPGTKDWYGPGEETTASGAANDFYHPIDTQTTSGDKQKPLVSSYETSEFYSYATPATGEYFCSIPLKKAIEEYGDTALYQIKVDVFSKGNHICEKKELEKIAEILYEKGYSPAIESRNNSDANAILTLLATKEQIEGFRPDDEHGYFFFLYKE